MALGAGATILFTNTDTRTSLATNKIYWDLLAAFHAGALPRVARLLVQAQGALTPDIDVSAAIGFEIRAMDRFAHPFGAISADLAASIWHLGNVSEHVERNLARLEAAATPELPLDGCYPAQMMRFVLGQSTTSDHFATVDRLAPELADLFEDPLERDAPFDGSIADIFQRSAAQFLSYNGNILFDVLSLLSHVQAGPATFEAVAQSAHQFREDVLSGKFRDLPHEQTIGSLAFLLPIYPKLFEAAHPDMTQASDIATNLYDKAHATLAMGMILDDK